jgi:hypothetical protein
MVKNLEKSAEEIENEQEVLAVNGFFQHKDELKAEELERQSRARNKAIEEKSKQKIAYIYSFRFDGKREYRIKDTMDGNKDEATFKHKKLRDLFSNLKGYIKKGYTISNGPPPTFCMGSYTCGSSDLMILAYRPRINDISERALRKFNIKIEQK